MKKQVWIKRKNGWERLGTPKKTSIAEALVEYHKQYCNCVSLSPNAPKPSH